MALVDLLLDTLERGQVLLNGTELDGDRAWGGR
jgi:hypothetical protein